MTNLWTSLRGKGEVEKRFSISDYANLFAYDGHQYPVVSGSSSTSDSESIGNDFIGYVNGAYKSDGVVFAALLARMMLFSEANFRWQRMPSEDLIDDTPELGLLRAPWPNGTTRELLSRMLQDVDLAGNFYAKRERTTGRLRRLRPDWVTISLTVPPAEAMRSDVKGYLYHPGGKMSRTPPEVVELADMVHWAPIPDPAEQYRGMSWLTPVLTEIAADKSATLHKKKFFDNGASLQTVMTLGESVTKDQFKEWVRKFREAHQGTRNAYEPLFLGGGADAKVVGADMKQLDFKVTQGAGETRIASAAGMHPVILGLSEGLAGSSLNAGNFNAARRLTADKTLRPLWGSACGALQTVMTPPTSARLWYAERSIAFLREDMKDLADVQQSEATTIRTLGDGGFDPESVTKAVVAQDWTLLKHTGRPSVQLQPDADAEPPDDDNGMGDDEGDET